MPSGRRCLEFSRDQYGEMDGRYRNGASLEELARDFGVTGPTIRAHLRKIGTPIRLDRHARGDRHGWWRGGRTVDASGYVRCWVDPSDPLFCMTNSSRQVPEHRLVMARHLGRPLGSKETVHHIDGDRQNNAIENLQLRVGRHGKGQALCCADCGSTNIIPTTI